MILTSAHIIAESLEKYPNRKPEVAQRAAVERSVATEVQTRVLAGNQMGNITAAFDHLK